MRLLKIFLLCCLFVIVALSQKPIVPLAETESKPILNFRSQINDGGFNERIIARNF